MEQNIHSTALVSKSANLGKNVKIGPYTIIEDNVVIGDNARIYSGAVIKNSIIGDNVIINEKAVVGANGFTMADNEDGNKVRIYSLGKVVIGNNVEIGVSIEIQASTAAVSIRFAGRDSPWPAFSPYSRMRSRGCWMQVRLLVG